MAILEKIYDNSPICMQNLMVTMAGFQRNLKRYGNTYWKHRAFLKDFDEWSLEKKIEYQRVALIDFVQYAATNSPFYQKYYSGVDINSIQNIDDLKILPIIDKETLRVNLEKVVTVPRLSAIEGHTGGTTGKSLVVFFTEEDNNKRLAVLDHFKMRVGFAHRKMKRATFNGKHIVPPKQKKKIFWRYNAACKQMIYSSFHITEINMRHYVDSLNRFKPHAIDGFFTSMCDIAGFIERHQLALTFKPIAIFPTSETLTHSGRELLERVFNCKVYNQYASSEGAPFITECRDQRLHMELSSGVFEHFENGSNEVLVTSFVTHGTPLIRYRIGDTMTFDTASEICTCRFESPMVTEIQGRRLDFLYTASGAKINAGNVANLFKNIPNAVIRAQTIQHQKDEIIIKLEIDRKLYKHEYDDLLRKEFFYKFGLNTKIIIEHVEEIPRESSGKFKLIKNHTPNIQ